jgi:hypothetical protein
MDNFVFSSRIGLKPLFVNLFSSWELTILLLDF